MQFLFCHFFCWSYGTTVNYILNCMTCLEFFCSCSLLFYVLNWSILKISKKPLIYQLHPYSRDFDNQGSTVSSFFRIGSCSVRERFTELIYVWLWATSPFLAVLSSYHTPTSRKGGENAWSTASFSFCKIKTFWGTIL